MILIDPADLLHPVPFLGSDGGIDTPLLAIDLSVPPRAVDRVAMAAAESDRVLVGVGAPAPGWEPLLPALGLTYVPAADAGRPELVGVPEPGEAVAHLAAVAVANPHAATTLAQVLRQGDVLPVPAALDLESLAYSTLLGGSEFGRWLATRGPRPTPEPVAGPVLAHREGEVLRISLNRPARRNAFGRQLRDELVAALDVAVHDRTVAQVVVDGNGPVFCSGGDLDEFGTAPDLVTAHLVRTRAGAGRRVHALRDRIEFRLHGACVGAGIEIPTLAGRVVADPGSTFRLPEVGMGLVPGAGGTVGVPRRIGRWRALHLALSGRALDAGTALDWGLVDALAGERRPAR